MRIFFPELMLCLSDSINRYIAWAIHRNTAHGSKEFAMCVPKWNDSQKKKRRKIETKTKLHKTRDLEFGIEGNVYIITVLNEWYRFVCSTRNTSWLYNFWIHPIIFVFSILCDVVLIFVIRFMRFKGKIAR